MQLRLPARRLLGVLAAGAVAAGSVLGFATPAMADSPVAPDIQVGFLAQAYGTYATSKIADLNSGPTGYTGLACTTEAGRSSTNNSAKVDLDDLGQAGATVSKVQSLEHDGVRSSVAESETAGVSLLGGLVKADAITSTSTATWDGSEYSAEQDSVFANLEVLGVPITIKPEPNTVIDLKLPGIGSIGKVELNKQEVVDTGSEYRVATTALKVSILHNNPFGIETGTQVTVGQSRAHLVQPQLGYLSGSGFATQVTLADGIVESGRTSLAGLACTGGNAKNNIAGADLGALGNAGAASTTAVGEVTDEAVTGEVVNEIAGVSLLNGLIEADAIRSVASVDLAAGDDEVNLSAEGSRIVGLKLNGEEILTADIAPNTTIDLLGLVTVTINKQVVTATKISVTQLEIALKDEIAGLPTGSKIEVSHAEAGITPSVS